MFQYNIHLLKITCITRRLLFFQNLKYMHVYILYFRTELALQSLSGQTQLQDTEQVIFHLRAKRVEVFFHKRVVHV